MASTHPRNPPDRTQSTGAWFGNGPWRPVQRGWRRLRLAFRGDRECGERIDSGRVPLGEWRLSESLKSSSWRDRLMRWCKHRLREFTAGRSHERRASGRST